MLAVPEPTAVTSPDPLTVATPVLLEDQVTGVSAGKTVAVSWEVFPVVREREVRSRLIPSCTAEFPSKVPVLVI